MLKVASVFIPHDRYCFFAIQFETYYRISPAQPLWVHAFYEKIKDLKPKRLPLADNQMHEQFKKRYNYKQAIKYKVIADCKLMCIHKHSSNNAGTLYPALTFYGPHEEQITRLLPNTKVNYFMVNV